MHDTWSVPWQPQWIDQVLPVELVVAPLVRSSLTCRGECWSGVERSGEWGH